MRVLVPRFKTLLLHSKAETNDEGVETFTITCYYYYGSFQM